MQDASSMVDVEVARLLQDGQYRRIAIQQPLAERIELLGFR